MNEPRFKIIHMGHTAADDTRSQDGGAPGGVSTGAPSFREAVAGRAVAELFEALDLEHVVPEFVAAGGLSREDIALYDRGMQLCQAVLGGGLPADVRPAVRAVTHGLAKWFAVVTHKAGNPRAVATLLAAALIDAAADLPDADAGADGLPWGDDPAPKVRAAEGA